jgi:hypothetical protein
MEFREVKQAMSDFRIFDSAHETKIVELLGDADGESGGLPDVKRCNYVAETASENVNAWGVRNPFHLVIRKAVYEAITAAIMEVDRGMPLEIEVHGFSYLEVNSGGRAAMSFWVLRETVMILATSWTNGANREIVFGGGGAANREIGVPRGERGGGGRHR